MLFMLPSVTGIVLGASFVTISLWFSVFHLRFFPNFHIIASNSRVFLFTSA